VGRWIVSSLPETVLQCLLIVISVVLALGVDEWKDARKEREMKVHSLVSFAHEIHANRDLLDGQAAFAASMPATLAGMESEGELRTAEDFYDKLGVSSFQPPALQATAWQTAVATGVVRLLDYHTVDVLSGTYGSQADYERGSERRLPDFLRTGTAPPGSIRGMVGAAARYMNDETQETNKLLAAYAAALDEIAAACRRLGETKCGRADAR
jgi:hypothetical protein